MKKFNFLSGIKIVHYSALGFLLYLTKCLKKFNVHFNYRVTHL